MAKPREPIELIEAKGAKHLTKAEKEARRSGEIKPIAENISPPPFLSAKQKKSFMVYAEQLHKLEILGETDVDALARYVVSSDLYIAAVKKLRKNEVKNDPELLEQWSKLEDRYCKQCRALANDLGLSISSRCKLVVPKPPEPKRRNKFEQFEKRASNG
jgi:P27 family predicted phage terminase small subunit